MRIELQGALQRPWYLAELLEATAERCFPSSLRIFGMTTDSNEVKQGDVFLAIKGAHTDGNTYIPQAIQKGAVAVLSERRDLSLPEHIGYFCCECVEDALLKAAGKWREICGAFVVGVTGSAGKTTTKEAIAQVLGDAPHNAGNYNSTVGMPLSILSFPKSDFWVCELGINHVGEMERMSLALRPDLGVITNVGSAHIGNFGKFSVLVKEKFKLCTGMGEKGMLVLPASLKNIGFPMSPCSVFCVGEGKTADFSVENITMSTEGVRCDLRYDGGEITNLRWPIPGVVGSSVLSFAAAVGVLCGRTPDQIREGIQKAACAPSHMSVYTLGERLFFEDCYNASPEACLAALEGLRYLAGERPRVAVLGDMLELGEHGDFLHRALGKSVQQARIDYLFTYGDLAAKIACGAKEAGMESPRIFSFAVGEERLLTEKLCALAPRDAAVLYKGSRALKMECVAQEVRRLL